MQTKNFLEIKTIIAVMFFYSKDIKKGFSTSMNMPVVSNNLRKLTYETHESVNETWLFIRYLIFITSPKIWGKRKKCSWEIWTKNQNKKSETYSIDKIRLWIAWKYYLHKLEKSEEKPHLMMMKINFPNNDETGRELIMRTLIAWYLWFWNLVPCIFTNDTQVTPTKTYRNLFTLLLFLVKVNISSFMISSSELLQQWTTIIHSLSTLNKVHTP